jgi:hypothetical protein
MATYGEETGYIGQPTQQQKDDRMLTQNFLNDLNA